MSLYGALYSGVSGLTAQSSAMGAISDNITNVSTVGYKNTQINFQTLVTSQTSKTFYSAGGVQSKPRQSVDVQGLLQSSTSQTDLALSGGGFFVVNGSSSPTQTDPYFFTRAGSFKMDSEGFLSNSAGYYLQAWPTDAGGTVIAANTALTQTNLNVISSDYVETVNLSRVAGSAAATSEISIGANLPANATIGDTHKTDVQYFDSLGQARSMSVTYTKTADNQWDATIQPTQGTASLSTYDSSGNVYDSYGQLEFSSRPADGSRVAIEGLTYEFDTKAFGWQTASASTNLTVSQSTYNDTFTVTSAGAGSSVVTAAGAPNNFVITNAGGAGDERITSAPGKFTGLRAGDSVTLAGFTTGGNNAAHTISAVAADGSYIEFTDGTLVGNDTMIAVATITFPTADRITAATSGKFTGLAVGNQVTLRAPLTDAGTSATITAIDAAGKWIEFADNALTTNEVVAAGKIEYTVAGASQPDRITSNTGTFTGLVVGDQVTMTSFTTGGNNVSATITAVAANGSYIEFADGTLANNETMTGTAAVTYFNAGAGETATLKRVDISASTTVAQDVDAIIAAVIANDTDFDTTNNRIYENPDYSNIVMFHEDGTRTIAVDPTGLLNSDGNAATKQTTAFNVTQVHEDYAPYTQFKFGAVVPDGQTMKINGTSYSFSAAETAGDNDTVISTAGGVASMLTDLEAAIEANDPYYTAGGSGVRLRADSNAAANNTLVLTGLSSGSYDVDFTGLTTASIVSDLAGTDLATKTVAVQTKQALNFDSKGQPSSINVASVQITGFDNGASDMDTVDSSRMSFDFGTVASTDGMTQFGNEYTPGFIQQNGSRFGTFAGVSISDDGLVTALFDNGDTRPVYQIPVATFTNPNGLVSQSGNVWNASEPSGDYTLRTAGNGSAGLVTQASLEASTVDIGEEFTNMIVVQRAYSASTKIISTADQMLEELMRVKR